MNEHSFVPSAEMLSSLRARAGVAVEELLLALPLAVPAEHDTVMWHVVADPVSPPPAVALTVPADPVVLAPPSPQSDMAPSVPGPVAASPLFTHSLSLWRHDDLKITTIKFSGRRLKRWGWFLGMYL